MTRPVHPAHSLVRTLAAVFAALALLVAGSTVASAAPKEVRFPGAVSGKVTHNGQPLAGVEVLVGYERDQSPGESPTTKTAADGTYTINNLSAFEGRETLTFTVRFHPGGEYASQWWKNSRTWDSATTITLGKGEVRGGIDAQLEKLGSIQGTVTHAGKPVKDALVRITNSEAKTDAAGKYVLPSAPPGSNSLIVTSPSTDIAHGSFQVTVNPGATTTANLELESSAKVSGRVTRGDKKAPVAGATVMWSIPDGSPTFISEMIQMEQSNQAKGLGYSPYGSTRGETKTAADGSYTIPLRDSGHYLVLFQAPTGSGLASEHWEDAVEWKTATLVEVEVGKNYAGYDAALGVGPSRQAGENRYETAAAIAASFTNAETVYIASGKSYPDALSGGPAAIAAGSPVLLVGDSINEKTAAQLTRLKPKEIVIVGGEGSVSAAVATSLRDYSASVKGLAGQNRYETSAAVSAATFDPKVSVAFIASGEDFADALNGTPAAGVASAPILLTKKGELPEATQAELARLKPRSVVVLGGGGSVSATVATDAAAAAGVTAATRLSGSDRYETAVAISKSRFPNATSVFIASGEVFPDALALGAHAGASKGPLLLVRKSSVPKAVEMELGRLKTTSVTVAGGTGTISTTTLNALGVAASRR
ncbi:cell wall-binding repeat-containing protein [Salana multivorans]